MVASSSAIVTNFLPEASASNLKLDLLSSLWPSLPLRQKNRTTWNHTFWSKVRGLVSAMAWEVLSFFKLCFTFSFPWRFKWTICAFSISVDLLKRGSEFRFKPRLKGGLFSYLSKECLNPRRVDLLYGSPALFLASPQMSSAGHKIPTFLFHPLFYTCQRCGSVK